MLKARCGAGVNRFAVMPADDGSDLYVLAVEGVIHVITPAHFTIYQRLCANEAVFEAAA